MSKTGRDGRTRRWSVGWTAALTLLVASVPVSAQPRTAAGPAPPVRGAPASELGADALSRLKPHERHLVRRYPALAAAITPQNLGSHLRALTHSESRVVGYPGERRAAEYVRQQLEELTGAVEEEQFRVTVPIDEGGELRLPSGESFRLRALWPNLVRTSQLPPEGLKAPILWAGSGKLSEFNGRDVAAPEPTEAPSPSDPATPRGRGRGAVVVVEFNSSSDWLNGARLGAEAILFVEPAETMRGEAENKFLSVPADIPRFWISRQDAARLVPLLRGAQPPQGVLTCRMPWKTVTARNFVARIEGWDPLDLSEGGARLAGMLQLDAAQVRTLRSVGSIPREGREAALLPLLTREQRLRWPEIRRARDEVIVLHAYYDAMSIVPSLAPGAESALSVSSLLELGKLYRDPRFRPRRTVWLVASSAHFLGLGGIKAYLDRHVDQFKSPGFLERAPVVRWGLLAALAILAFTSAGRAVRRRSLAWGAVGAAALALILPLAFFRGSGAGAAGSPRVLLFAGLDLSSRSEGVGLFYKGYFYDQREDIQGKFSELARVTRENSERVGAVLGRDPKSLFADAVNPIEGKDWRSYIPGKIALDSEVWTMAGGRGIGLVTVEDGRQMVDTPFDTLDRVDVENVVTQTRTLACLIDHYLNDAAGASELNALRIPLMEVPQFARLGLNGGFAALQGRVVRFDLRESFIPSTPVPGSLVVVPAPQKTLMGVRSTAVQEVGPDGSYRLVGIAPSTAYQTRKITTVHAYHLSEATGEVDYAPDLGHTGARAYPIEVSVNLPTKHVQVIVFKCASTSLYDFVDPQTLRTLTDVHVYDGATNAEPRLFGLAVSKPERYQAIVEDVAVLFAQPGFAIKLVMGTGPGAIRYVLINSTYARERVYASEGGNRGRVLRSERQGAVSSGIGYKLGEQPLEGARPSEIAGATHDRTFERTIPHATYLTARDMWLWDDRNAEKLRRYRIINQQLDQLHDRAGQLLNEAEAAFARKDYAAAYAAARRAHGYEARAYPEVQKTARDVVQGVLFYLALLLPFAFFFERLVIASTSLKDQLSWMFAIFVVVFIVMSRIHPAFDITMSPMIVLLAFIMLVLSVLVIALITGKFEQQVKEYNRQVSGTHSADIGRMSIAAAAFSLGISNMRRRKARTVLTCVTLVLLTFIVLSFTSVVSALQYNVVPSPGAPRYDGVLLRSQMWEPLEESSYRLLRDEFGQSETVAPRAWYFGTQPGDQTFLTLRRGEHKFDTRAVLGLTEGESRVTRADEALLAGRWLQDGDVYATLLPKTAAEALEVTPESVGSGTAYVRFAGADYQVVGLLDDSRFQAVRDLDQEPLTPADLVTTQKPPGTPAGTADAGFLDYTHLDPASLFVIPYRTLMNLGGEVRSVAVRLEGPEDVRRTRLDLMPRLGLNLYAGEGARTFRYSATGGTSIAGAATLVIPISIAALIVLQTMLGAVFERKKEIHIFSSIGLAPNHVAILFIAEALVYAVLGAMAGYILGQGSAKLIVAFNLFPGLNLNFSSLSAVFSTALVMGVVVLSAWYPARLAGEVATPALERGWKTPEPVGDRWEIPLPFMVTGEQAAGLNGFLSEWFRAYEEYSVGDFVTQAVTSEATETGAGTVYRLHLTAWLAPFDLGVSQRVELDTTPTDMEDVFALTLVLHRRSGDSGSWKRVNRRFLNTLRKQFLIWRTLSTEERERYLS